MPVGAPSPHVHLTTQNVCDEKHGVECVSQSQCAFLNLASTGQNVKFMLIYTEDQVQLRSSPARTTGR